MLTFEEYLVDLLLEHQYLTTLAIHLYLTRWFLSLASLGDRCLFITYAHSLTACDLFNFALCKFP